MGLGWRGFWGVDAINDKVGEVGEAASDSEKEYLLEGELLNLRALRTQRFKETSSATCKRKLAKQRRCNVFFTLNVWTLLEIDRFILVGVGVGLGRSGGGVEYSLGWNLVEGMGA